MKVIVAGSRDGVDKDWVFFILTEALSDEIADLEIVSGTARGADQYGEEWAYAVNVDVKQFPADWEKYGKRAGFLRNAEMARYADMLIAFWDDESKGTAHMIKVMTDLKKPVHIYSVDGADYEFETEDDDD